MNLKRLIVAVTMLLFVTQTNAQDKTVTGKVTDASGAAVSGATIKVKGKAIGKTNADGTFSVKAATNSNLEFTSVGFTTMEMQVPASGAMNISLKTSNDNLNEVVVIGYGSAKKKDLTGSVVSVTSKDFVKGAITTPEQLITGKVAGVSIINSGGAPGASSAIRIRGGSSVNASNDPLIVIDGVPIDNSGISGSPNPLSLINPNDIESFNILKDASSAAIYGTRASNGVIIITTKRGKTGKPTYSFSSLFSVYTPAKKVDVMSADEIRAYVNANGDATYKSQLGTNSVNWQDEIYKTAVGTDNNLSMTGSIFKKVPFRASVGYLNQQGILRTGSLKRNSASIVASPKFFKDHLKVDINLKGVVSESRFANEGAIGAALTANPTLPIYSDNKLYNNYYEVLNPSKDNGLADAARNPLGLLNDNFNLSHVERSIGNIQFDYKFHFLPDLRIVANVGYDVSKGHGTVKVADSTGQGYKRFKGADGLLHSGTNNQYLQEKTAYVVDGYLNYTKSTQYGDFDVLVGQSYQENKTKSYNFQDNANDGAIKDEKTFFAPYGLGNNVLVGYYSRLRYSLKDKYFFTASYRTDGSSRFRTGNRWGTFPAGSVAWRISKESFFKNVKFVNDLKLRFGYGVTGQQDGFGDYVYLPNYQPVINQSTYQFGNTFLNTVYTPLAYSTDPKFSWEKTTMYNYGIDFSLFNNRITGYIEYYNRTTKDLLFAANKSAGSQFSNIFISNAGTQLNEGVELSFNATIIKKKDFNWDLGFNINYNKNTITQTSTEPNPNIPGLLTGGISGGVGNTVQIQAVGQARQAFYSYKQVYDQKTGKPLDGVFEDVNRDGVINEKDLLFYKKPDPTVFAGLTASVNYKKWNFGFVARGSYDNYIYNNVNSNTATSRRVINTDNQVVNNGSREILNSNLSGKGDKYLLSNYWIENGSFIRVDNINIGYNVGKVFKGAANLRVSGNVQNAFVITKYSGLDPEISGGIDNNIYARPRVFVLGVNLDF